MTDSPTTGDDTVTRPDEPGRGELRTIGFRLRELQRLLSMRVEQENRRMEAEGLEPVTRPRFMDPADAGRERPPES